MNKRCLSIRKILIAPSLLSADFAYLAEEIRKVEMAGCDMLHLDVMDGHFVPNITLGPFIVKAIRRITKLPLDVHLMIENPQKYISSFAEAGADHITVHYEACSRNLKKILKYIHANNCTAGVSIKPKTRVEVLRPYLGQLERALFMTVNPGFGGQAFMPKVVQKIRTLRQSFEKDIQVDGGINLETAKMAVNAGANILVAGTSIFGQRDVAKAVAQLRWVAVVNRGRE